MSSSTKRRASSDQPDKCTFDWDISRKVLLCQIHERHRISVYVDRAGEMAVLWGLWMDDQLTGEARREIEG